MFLIQVHLGPRGEGKIRRESNPLFAAAGGKIPAFTLAGLALIEKRTGQTIRHAPPLNATGAKRRKWVFAGGTAHIQAGQAVTTARDPGLMARAKVSGAHCFPPLCKDFMNHVESFVISGPPWALSQREIIMFC
ncbi:unnamed protein product [Larinioides sclopetarius]|uniref:Uncharacterized protein n=1 Tax=Larinioides sclopetarius TaxID=280406 RepID=A0AAV2BPE0_9ARAC